MKAATVPMGQFLSSRAVESIRSLAVAPKRRAAVPLPAAPQNWRSSVESLSAAVEVSPALTARATSSNQPVPTNA